MEGAVTLSFSALVVGSQTKILESVDVFLSVCQFEFLSVCLSFCFWQLHVLFIFFGGYMYLKHLST